MNFNHVKLNNMKLSDVLSVIDDHTFIIIYYKQTKIFHKERYKVYRYEWYEGMEKYLSKDVVRINAVDGEITIYI